MMLVGFGSSDPCADGPSNPNYDPAICAIVAPGTTPAQSFDSSGTPDLGTCITCPDGSTVCGAAPTCPMTPTKIASWPFYVVGALPVIAAGALVVLGVFAYKHYKHAT